MKQIIKRKVKKTIIKVKEFDYSVLFKIIFFLGIITILIFSVSGCDRHQPKEYRNGV